MTSEPSSPAMSDSADPSMEEILASIRRILNDDDVPAEPLETAPAGASDVLVLDESMLVAEPAFDHSPPEPVVMDDEPEVIGPPQYLEPRERPVPNPGLVAPETAAAA